MKSFRQFYLFPNFQVSIVFLVCFKYGMCFVLSTKPNAINSGVIKNDDNSDCSRYHGTNGKPKCNFSAEYLMTHTFAVKVSDDIDMDPCKSGGFMGDIALADINYETQWQTQGLTRSFQQEMERLKQEVFYEGLQVEEEGLTDIIRMKTRLLNSESEAEPKSEKSHDNIEPNLNSFSIVNNGSTVRIVRVREFVAIKKNISDTVLHNEPGRIQSDTKDILYNFGENILQLKKLNTAIKTKFSKRIINSKLQRPIVNDMQSVKEPTTPLQNTAQAPMTEPVQPDNTTKQLLHHNRTRRAATAKKERIWDYGVIPYEIDANFSGAHKALFKQAMRHWENFTCIKFVERVPVEHPNFIAFTTRACGCCSFVGKRGRGGQAISIGKNCDKFGIVVHELGHVVGFWHEHTRPDRENHVVIDRANILNGQEYNFNKLTSADVDSLGLPYDYDSIMHYAKNTFSKGAYLDTILPTRVTDGQRPEIGQRLRLSKGDIAQANLLYKCAKCGRTFQENAAAFTSPNYHINNRTSAVSTESCEWRITATHGERIILNITDLDIKLSTNCQSDYLEIRDGYWHKSAVLGRYCGTDSGNVQIKSTGSCMLVTFVTTHSPFRHRGFAANYEAVCGGAVNLKNGSGHLESPNYPLDYLPNKECIWRITVQEEYQVALKFQSFYVENHDNCVYDYVEIRDGDGPESRLIGIFCGYKIPPNMRSTTNKMFVKFVSDGSVQKAGFSATFLRELDECDRQNHGCEHECINTLGGYRCSCNIGYELHSDKKSCENACGGIMDASNGTITSPSFPDVYPMSKECIWEIIAQPQYRITLKFTHFDLEGNSRYQQDCDYDSVRIYSKRHKDNLRRHGIFCGGKIPPLITSDGNVMRIVFRSDATVQKSGFAAIFSTYIDACAVNNGGCMHECNDTIGSNTCSCRNGYILQENGLDCKEGGCKHDIKVPHGQIYSPNYPNYYPAKTDCVWHFSTMPGHRIKLVFTVFEMEQHQECAYDHVTIYNGASSDSFSLGQFCGGEVPHPIGASSNEMFMVFKTDVSVQRGGFAATHSTDCGGHLTATRQLKHFYSHVKYGDFNYDNDVDCEWSIEAEVGRNVQLIFRSFDLEDDAGCSYDYVDVFGGMDDYSGLHYGSFCGTNKPMNIVSTHEALLVRFRSDSTVMFKGFAASYVAVDSFEGSE